MQAGKQRYKFALERPSDVTGAIKWNLVTYVWGSLRALSGKSSPVTEQSATLAVELRWRQDIRAGDRLRLPGGGLGGADRVFQQTSVPLDPDGRRRSLNLLVEELLS